MRITKSLKTKLAGLLIVALCVSVAAPAMAGAQQVSPTGDQYDNELTQLNQGAEPPASGGSGSASASGLGGNVGPLPFTGFDVIAMAAVALAITGLGLGRQRAVSRDPSESVGLGFGGQLTRPGAAIAARAVCGRRFRALAAAW